MTGRTESEMVAYALEVAPELLPFITELLADLEELGSDAEDIVELIESLDLPNDATVVDLGCGKGAVSVEIAAELGLNVLGIDLFEPFIPICEAAAQAAGVAHLCSFRHGNVATLAGEIAPADVAVFAALGDVLGPLDETLRIIRRYVKPGGYVVISDGFLRDGGSTDFPGFEGYVSHGQTIAGLTRWGDEVAREILFEENDDAEDEDTPLISARADALAKLHPELADKLAIFVRDQGAEVEFIGRNLAGALWAIRKASP